MGIAIQDLRVLVIGLKYEKSFRLIDRMGEMFELILHDSSSPFGTSFFPGYDDHGFEEKILLGRNGTFMKICSEEIVLRYVMNSKADIKKEMDWFINDAIAFISEQLINNYKIRDIMRIGLMFTHFMSSNNASASMISKLTDNKIQNADQFSLSFGKKDTAIAGWTKKQVDDHINMITLLKQIDGNHYDITLDYQYYFKPVLEKLGDWPINGLWKRSVDYLNKDFYGMINLLAPEGVLIHG